MDAMVQRMIRAARLEPGLYEEVENDSAATGQAFLVVVLVSVVSGLGNALVAVFRGHPNLAVGGLISGVITALVGFVVFAFVAYIVGTMLFGGKATPGEVMRTMGFAYTPLALGFFGFIPLLGGLITLVGVLWAWVAGVIAIRQALDVDTTKAVLTIIVAAVVLVIVSIVLALLGVGLSILGGTF